MHVDFGDVVALGVTVRDATGTPANATAVTCTVTEPDGTVTAVPTSNVGAGEYVASIVPTQAGLHGVHWVATGTNASAYRDSFTVAAPSVPLVSLREVKDRLNITDDSKDEELRRICAAAAGRAAAEVGRALSVRTTTQTKDMTDRDALVLAVPVPALLSVDSVTQDGVAVTDWVLSDDGQYLRRQGRSRWTGVVQIVGTVGVAGDDLAVAQQAVLELIAHLWETQRTPMGRNMPMDGPRPGVGYSLPNRVVEMLDPLRLPGGFA